MQVKVRPSAGGEHVVHQRAEATEERLPRPARPLSERRAYLNLIQVFLSKSSLSVESKSVYPTVRLSIRLNASFYRW